MPEMIPLHGARRGPTIRRITLLVVAALLAGLTVQCRRENGEDLSGKSLDELIERLGSEDFRTREAADAEIVRRVRQGAVSVPQLVAIFGAADDAEVKSRLDVILARFGYRLLFRLVTVWNVIEAIAAALQRSPLPSQQELERLADRLRTARNDLKRAVEDPNLTIPPSNKSDVQGLELDLELRENDLRKLRGQPNPTQTAGIVRTLLLQLQKRTKDALDGLGDLDGDAIPPSWELRFGLDPGKNDGNEDPDGDGATNSQEFTRGSNPRVAD